MKKPRASPPTTISGRRGSAHSASRSIVSASESRSASSGMMSRKITPFWGQSGTSRILALSSSTPIRGVLGGSEAPQRPPQEELRELLRELGEGLEVLQCRLTALGFPRAERRPDELLEEQGLAVGRGAERSQVARADAEGRETGAGRGDLGVARCIPLLPPVPTGFEQAVLLQLANELRRPARALGELARVELLLRARQACGALSPLRLRHRRRRQLLADHPERQELVTLEAQDRSQALVAVLDLARLDPAPVQERSVQAALVLDEELPVAPQHESMAPRDRHVVEEDVAIGRAPDGDALLLEQEVLACSASSRAHDERRSLGLDLLGYGRGLLLPLLGRIAHRRVRPRLVPHQERAALRAVVRRF